MTFDIVIVTYNREMLLEQCLQSIFENSIPELNRVIVVNNGGRDVSKINHIDHDKVLLISTQKKSPGEARNEGILRLNSDYVLFLDDDTYLPKSYFLKAVKHLQDRSIDVLGGPDQTFPNASSFQMALGIALTSPLSTGPTRLRHSTSNNILKGSEVNLILCHLWFRTSIFTQENFLFNKKYFRNEENVLLEELRNDKKNLVHISDLFVYHYRKDNLKDIGRVTFQSAFFRKKSILSGDSHFDLLFFIPSITLILLLVLLIINLQVFLIVSLLYSVVSLVIYNYLKPKNFLENFYAFFIQLFINVSYGVGMIIPLFMENLILKKN